MADPSALLRHRPLVFVDDVEQPRLSDADRHHFERVQRVRAGAEIVVGDGLGRWRPALFGPEPEPTGPVAETAPPDDPVTVAFAPVKGTKPEWLVQKLTELGVDVIRLVTTERSVVRWDDDRRRRLHSRLTAAAREACLQCRRLIVPVVADPVPLSALLAAEPSALVADPDGSSPRGDERFLIVGPEGGFGPEEVADRRTVALPGHVLRAETAALAAATVLVGLRAEVLGPAHRAP